VGAPPTAEDHTASDAASPEGRPRRRRVTPTSVLLTLAMLGIITMWAYAYSGLAARNAPDYLEDRSWAAAAETTCAATLTRIHALPRAFEAPDAAARADVIDRADEELRAMLADLRSRPPSNPRDQAIVRQWLDDYDRYVANRADYAARLRSDAGARFYVDQKGAKQVTEPIDGFARSNEMTSCASPDDVS
jgi:hypothetical protein